MRNVGLDTTARVAPPVMAQSFVLTGTSVRLALVLPRSALLAITKTRKEPRRKMSANFVLQAITAPVAQRRRGNVRQGRFRPTRGLGCKPNVILARRAWHARWVG